MVRRNNYVALHHSLRYIPVVPDGGAEYVQPVWLYRAPRPERN